MIREDYPSRRRHGSLFLLTATILVAIDQITKLWVRNNLASGEPLILTSFLQLSYIENTGSAFGLLANQAFLLTIISLVSLLFLFFLYRYFSTTSLLATLALAMVFGGAVGNLVDRLRFGYVTDFIDFCLWHDFHWPAFNVADSAITVGALTLVYFLFSLTGKRK